MLSVKAKEYERQIRARCKQETLKYVAAFYSGKQLKVVYDLYKLCKANYQAFGECRLESFVVDSPAEGRALADILNERLAAEV